MMNNNKILTVSYGTFSCTLEGFDDSFGTMKAIAEYFRDLAADDRYFGAEPPQPDADMLARIAQREVSRRVQAHERDGKIVLSALEDQSQPAVETAQDTPAEPVQDTPAPSVIAAATAVVDTSLSETTADVSQDATEADQSVDLAAEVSETTENDVEAVGITSQSTVEEDENDIVPGQPDAEVEAFFNEAKQHDTPVDKAPEAASGGRSETIADKLQRIRAVVAQNSDTDDADGYAEDQHADAKADKVEAEADQVAQEADDIADVAAEDVDEPDERVLDQADEVASDSDDAYASDDDEDDVADDDDVDAILERLAMATSADADALEDTDLSENADTVNLFEDDAQPQNAAAEAPQETAPRARVIKVKRADLEAAIRKGTLEEYDDDGEDAAPQAAKDLPLDQIAPSRSKKSSLSAEDEQELARELANLEMDIEAENADDPQEAIEAEEENPLREARKRRENRRDQNQENEGRDTDVSRLLAEADQQMDEPESATRRDAISHLRAAVASQKADDALGGSAKDETTDDAYRDDLAQVVRPRRPESGGQRTARPNEGRPAPLKLVAEQRVDVASARSEGPVRPRRVSAAPEITSTSEEADSFADYAAEMGATTLPHLLEAAASYMSFVEGRDQFSRPQLMTKVRQSGAQEDFSREDGLRSFGQLLRAGKIAKIKGGRFTVSDDIGFQPDKRAAG